MFDEITRWDEIDVQDLGRLMIRAGELRHAIDDYDPIATLDSVDGDALDDARYHARKLYFLLSRLAIAAQRTWQAAADAEEADAQKEEGE